MDTALVTGGAGFLGSHVADEVLRHGLRVVVVDDLSGGFARNIPAGSEFHEGSVSDDRLVQRLFRRYHPRYVYHLAAYAAEGLSHFIRRFNYANNLLGSVNVINAAINHGTECLVFTSSAAVYGAAPAPCTEETPPEPEDPYGIAKLAVERDLAAASRLFGLRYVVFRPHNVYGERQNLSDPYRNVIGIFMRQVMAGHRCTVFGDGRQTRAFSYVGDVTPLIARSAFTPEAHGQIMNIGADATCTLLDLASAVQRALGREVGVEHLPDRQEVKHTSCDHRRVRRLLGEVPSTPLDEGLARMGRWARTIDLRSPRPISGIEIEKRLPPSWARLTVS
jgi:UDP-glucose 4-epimerase